MTALTYYRIGDFAKKLGVTPDLLKYCEKKGLITSVQQSNGYRYYDFSQSANVLEYLKLKNQGFSAEQAYEILHAGSFREFAAKEAAREEELEKQLHYTRALQRYLTEIYELRDLFTTPPRWYLRKHPAFYFLPHSLNDQLENDDACLSRISQWTRWLPVVCSATNLGCLETPTQSIQWGLAAEADFARKQGLDLTPPVRSIPSRLCLEIFLTQDLGHGVARQIRDVSLDLLTRLELRQSGDAFQLVLAKLWTGETRMGYSIVCIPVEGAHGE